MKAWPEVTNPVVWFYQLMTQQLMVGTCSAAFTNSTEHV